MFEYFYDLEAQRKARGAIRNVSGGRRPTYREAKGAG
jgi:hypothetical protein